MSAVPGFLSTEKLNCMNSVAISESSSPPPPTFFSSPSSLTPNKRCRNGLVDSSVHSIPLETVSDDDREDEYLGQNSSSIIASRADSPVAPPSTRHERATVREREQELVEEEEEDDIPLPPGLSEDQRDAYKACIRGYNVFLTGGGGCGKSFILNKIASELKRMKGEDKVFITASTGIAATHIGAVTLHAFVGGGLCDDVDKKTGNVSETSLLDRSLPIHSSMYVIFLAYYEKLTLLSTTNGNGSRNTFNRKASS
jgi:hypothetical protein